MDAVFDRSPASYYAFKGCTQAANEILSAQRVAQLENPRPFNSEAADLDPEIIAPYVRSVKRLGVCGL